MPLLQVRDCPEDIYEKITLVARKEHRTIAQQAIVLLEKSLGERETNKERIRIVLDRIEKRNIPDTVKKIDDVALIREDRNNR
jgi:hypothetical protein